MVAMSKRSRLIWFSSAGLLVLVGVTGGVALGGTIGQVLAIVLVGLGLILATALVFFEVGLSEDRERAREEAERRRREQPPRPKQRSVLERRRGRRRGLQ